MPYCTKCCYKMSEFFSKLDHFLSLTFSTLYICELLEEFFLCGLHESILFCLNLFHSFIKLSHAGSIIDTIKRKAISFNAALFDFLEWWRFIGVTSITVYFWCNTTAIYKAAQTMGVNQDNNGLDKFRQWPVVFSFNKCLYNKEQRKGSTCRMLHVRHIS